MIAFLIVALPMILGRIPIVDAERDVVVVVDAAEEVEASPL